MKSSMKMIPMELDTNGILSRHLPNILYQSPLSNKNSTGDYIEIKKYFS